MSLPTRPGTDLRGAGALAIDGVTGMVDLVEAVHASIAALPWTPATGRPRLSGIAQLVYDGVRGTTRVVGGGVDHSLALLAPLLDAALPGSTGWTARREATLAALNGVLGDHLDATRNPLAIPMTLRNAGVPLPVRGRALARALPHATGRVLVLAHGLCMNDLQWHHGGHDHGAALARDAGYTPVYLHYNTGLRVVDNGRGLSNLLEALLRAWPVPVGSLAIVGHSMGGLVARAALAAAAERAHAWPDALRHVAFLGTPHLGAPLEQAGGRIDRLLGFSRYTAPFARLGGIRSAGIRDLRHGTIGASHLDAGKAVPPVTMPSHVRAYAVAATTRAKRAQDALGSSGTDGLVRVESAFGLHAARRLSLRIPAARRALVHQTNHFGLLGSAEAYRHLLRWLR